MLNTITKAQGFSNYNSSSSNSYAKPVSNSSIYESGRKSDTIEWSKEGLSKLKASQDNDKSGLLTPKQLEEIRQQTQQMLIDTLGKSKESKESPTAKLIDPMLYNVADDEKAADVPEYWNSENTSQRIVDFSMSFQEVSGQDYEEYLEKARKAVEKGFKEAKDILGELPGPSAKLFNDTYEATMKKFDELLKNHREGKGTSEGAATPALDVVSPRDYSSASNGQSLNLVA